MKKWVAEFAPGPIWRDGLTSTKSYLIIAVLKTSDKYNCVCIRNVGEAFFKLKFYPDAAAWGMTHAQLKNDFGVQDFLYRSNGAGYERFCINGENLKKLAEFLNAKRAIVAVTPPMIRDAFQNKSQCNLALSLAAHPIRGGGSPETPFKRPSRLALSAPVFDGGGEVTNDY